MKSKHIFMMVLPVLFGKAVFAQKNQECNAEHFFKKKPPCNALNVGKKCIQLQVNDNEGQAIKKAFVYQWDFDDGSKERGLLVKHCYKNYGMYTIMLDLIDEKNDVIIKNEFSRKIFLIPPLKVESIDTVYSDVLIHFKYDSKGYKNDKHADFFWQIGDKFYCGEKIEYLFENPGFYLVKVGVHENPGSRNEIIGCGVKGIFVKHKNQ